MLCPGDDFEVYLSCKAFSSHALLLNQLAKREIIGYFNGGSVQYNVHTIKSRKFHLNGDFTLFNGAFGSSVR